MPGGQEKNRLSLNIMPDKNEQINKQIQFCLNIGVNKHYTKSNIFREMKPRHRSFTAPVLFPKIGKTVAIFYWSGCACIRDVDPKL